MAKAAKPLALRYAPQKVSQIPGRQNLAKTLINFVNNYAKQKKKAILLHGPSGVGKTSIVTALAKECETDIFELNASDKRNKSFMEELILPVITTQSLFGGSKIVLMDEIDGLSGQNDRGGASALAKLIPQSKFPIIMTANDGYADKLKPIRKIADVIEVPPLQTKDVVEILSQICQKENIKATEQILARIISKNSGDVRGSINDLELAAILSKELTDDSIVDLAERMKTESMEDALQKIFKTMDPNIALQSLDSVQVEYRDWFSWIDYNMPREYTGVMDRAKAQGAISRADIFMRRIMRQQHWRLLLYVKELLTAGVALSKAKPYTAPISYKQSSRGLQIWMLNNKIAKKRAIASKIAHTTHTSTRRVMQQWDAYASLLQNENVCDQLDLDDAEREWVKKQAA